MPGLRNFSIIAHIDHGKSTLADRFLQLTGLVDDRTFHDQFLDSMDIERERGITIKSQTVALPWTDPDGEPCVLNLIDTPGHVDFTYEVSRALAACEGVLLVVDATQGVEAQTLANLYLALEQDLEVIPVINKIDLPAADPERVREQIGRELGLDPEGALLVSAKDGTGVPALFEAIVARIPPPAGDSGAPLAVLVFDAHYDSFRGAIMSVRVVDGVLRPGQAMQFVASGRQCRVEEVGVFQPGRVPRPQLAAGEVGYVVSGLKTVADVAIGDTLTDPARPVARALPGFRALKPVVFSSVYPVASEDYPALVEALEKYKLNDAALDYERDASAALGQGFRCGFLGLLHLEVFEERMDREYDQALVLTAPSVQYRVEMNDGSTLVLDNPHRWPDESRIARVLEPFIRAQLLFPERYTGIVTRLCLERRGVDQAFAWPSPGRVELAVDLPLAEVVYDFYDRLKTITQGYGSFDYEFLDWRPSPVVKLDILVNGERVDALSLIVHEDRARARALQMCERLEEEIPRHQFKIAIQGAVGGRIVARTTVNALRKDVTAKCYGGDITRKRKLLDRQARGKKRMKMVGEVHIPQHAYVAVLKSDTD